MHTQPKMHSYTLANILTVVYQKFEKEMIFSCQSSCARQLSRQLSGCARHHYMQFWLNHHPLTFCVFAEKDTFFCIKNKILKKAQKAVVFQILKDKMRRMRVCVRRVFRCVGVGPVGQWDMCLCTWFPRPHISNSALCRS